jgi:hypothetical protein
VSKRGHDFLVRWVDENIFHVAHVEGDHSRVKQLAECCIADAQAAGISWKELGNLVNYISQARRERREVARLAERADGSLIGAASRY